MRGREDQVIISKIKLLYSHWEKRKIIAPLFFDPRQAFNERAVNCCLRKIVAVLKGFLIPKESVDRWGIEKRMKLCKNLLRAADRRS